MKIRNQLLLSITGSFVVLGIKYITETNKVNLKLKKPLNTAAEVISVGLLFNSTNIKYKIYKKLKSKVTSKK